MFTEKDIELAKKIKEDVGDHLLFHFIFLKLAQLENENKRLNDMIEKITKAIRHNPDK